MRLNGDQAILQASRICRDVGRLDPKVMLLPLAASNISLPTRRDHTQGLDDASDLEVCQIDQRPPC